MLWKKELQITLLNTIFKFLETEKQIESFQVFLYYLLNYFFMYELLNGFKKGTLYCLTISRSISVVQTYGNVKITLKIIAMSEETLKAKELL